MPNMIKIVDPSINRGRPPRDITLRDIITVPVTHQRGEFPLRDMLNLRSVEALWVAHNRIADRKNKELARKRAAHKSA